MTVLGIDAALRTTGYGLLAVEGKRLRALDCGVIRTKASEPHSQCLRRLAGGIGELIETYQPDVAAIEGGFFHRNAKTAMVLGMARGVVVAALATAGIETYEYAPRRVKQAVVGHGGADKSEVADIIGKTLNITVKDIASDATDALGIALCHALTQQSANGLYLPERI